MSKILGIDYGDVHCGLAISDFLCEMALPKEAIKTARIFSYIEDLSKIEQISTIVVGLPLSLKGTDTAQTEKTRAFAQFLREKFPDYPVILFDERYSTKLSEGLLSGSFAKKRQKKDSIQILSAVTILQAYLDAKN